MKFQNAGSNAAQDIAQDMINTRAMSSSAVLSTLRCSDPELIMGMLPGIRRRLLPLAGDFELFQANLRLGDLRLVIVKRPPCTSEGYLDQGQIGIAMALGGSRGLKLDGLPLDRPVLVSHGLTNPHRIFQPDDLTIAAVFLAEGKGDRGWPERTRQARVTPVHALALEQLRSTIKDVAGLASRDALRFSQASVVAGMQQSVLGAIDHAYATAPDERPAGLAVGNYVRICRIADEFIRAGARDLPCSAEVAAAAGVTIRTLHNAMVAVNGMSLQKFMILNRLWAARAALLRAAPGDLVKTIAFDNGFWHLGRFSQAYRAFFGESPSDTLMHTGAA